ncbi:hypothetical protein NFI96_014214, partial [Prochilodus magdalenae]
FRSPSHLSGLNRSASLNYTDRTESQSISGSTTQLNSTPSPQYVPDFNVRALTDLQIAKITRAQYQNGLMASRLDSSPQSPDSGHTHVDQNTPMENNTPLVPQFHSEYTLTLPLTYTPPDEHTSLLNEQNCLPGRQTSHNIHNDSSI